MESQRVDRGETKLSVVRDYEALLQLFQTLHVFPDALRWTTLTAEEAAKVRALGFDDAEPGRFRFPPIPPRLTRDNPSFESWSHGWVESQLAAAGASSQGVPPSRQDGNSPVPRLSPRSQVSEPPVERVPLQPLQSVPCVPQESPASTLDVEQQPDGVEHLRGTDVEQVAQPVEQVEQFVAGRELTELQRKIVHTLEAAGGSIERRKLQKKLWRHRAQDFGSALQVLIAVGSLRQEGRQIMLCSTAGDDRANE